MEKNFDNKFKIKVIGAVKHGKSTMLNSLIGYEIFSNEILPDSAQVFQVQHNSQIKESEALFQEQLIPINQCRLIVLNKNKQIRDNKNTEINTMTFEVNFKCLDDQLINNNLIFVDEVGFNEAKDVLQDKNEKQTIIQSQKMFSQHQKNLTKQELILYTVNCNQLIQNDANTYSTLKMFFREFKEQINNKQCVIVLTRVDEWKNQIKSNQTLDQDQDDKQIQEEIDNYQQAIKKELNEILQNECDDKNLRIEIVFVAAKQVLLSKFLFDDIQKNKLQLQQLQSQLSQLQLEPEEDELQLNIYQDYKSFRQTQRYKNSNIDALKYSIKQYFKDQIYYKNQSQINNNPQFLQYYFKILNDKYLSQLKQISDTCLKEFNQISFFSSKQQYKNILIQFQQLCKSIYQLFQQKIVLIQELAIENKSNKEGLLQEYKNIFKIPYQILKQNNYEILNQIYSIQFENLNTILQVYQNNFFQEFKLDSYKSFFQIQQYQFQDLQEQQEQLIKKLERWNQLLLKNEIQNIKNLKNLIATQDIQILDKIKQSIDQQNQNYLFENINFDVDSLIQNNHQKYKQDSNIQNDQKLNIYKQFQENLKNQQNEFTNQRFQEINNKIQTIQQRNNQIKFKIIVVGKCKHGKSTLLNSLLGNNINSTEYYPDTALDYKIYYQKNVKPGFCIVNGKEIKIQECKIQIKQQNMQIRKNQQINDQFQEIGLNYDFYDKIEEINQKIEIIDTIGLQEEIIQGQQNKNQQQNLDIQNQLIEQQQIFSKIDYQIQDKETNQIFMIYCLSSKIIFEDQNYDLLKRFFIQYQQLIEQGKFLIVVTQFDDVENKLSQDFLQGKKKGKSYTLELQVIKQKIISQIQSLFQVDLKHKIPQIIVFVSAQKAVFAQQIFQNESQKDRIDKFEQLKKKGLIRQSEFDTQQKEIMSKKELTYKQSNYFLQSNIQTVEKAIKQFITQYYLNQIKEVQIIKQKLNSNTQQFLQKENSIFQKLINQYFSQYNEDCNRDNLFLEQLINETQNYLINYIQKELQQFEQEKNSNSFIAKKYTVGTSIPQEYLQKIQVHCVNIFGIVFDFINFCQKNKEYRLQFICEIIQHYLFKNITDLDTISYVQNYFQKLQMQFQEEQEKKLVESIDSDSYGLMFAALTMNAGFWGRIIYLMNLFGTEFLFGVASVSSIAWGTATLGIGFLVSGAFQNHSVNKKIDQLDVAIQRYKTEISSLPNLILIIQQEQNYIIKNMQHQFEKLIE